MFCSINAVCRPLLLSICTALKSFQSCVASFLSLMNTPSPLLLKFELTCSAQCTNKAARIPPTCCYTTNRKGPSLSYDTTTHALDIFSIYRVPETHKTRVLLCRMFLAKQSFMIMLFQTLKCSYWPSLIPLFTSIYCFL